MSKPKGEPTPRKKFTDYYKLGDYVSITRTRHGWYDGEKYGYITQISEYQCIVLVGEYGTHFEYEIDYVRDIRPG